MNEDLEFDETEEKNLYLCFVNLVGQEEDGNYRYEFIFTDNPDEVWGDDFEYKPCSLINNLMVAEEYKTETHIVKTKIQFDLIQNNGCFGMQDCMDGVVSLCFENIDGYDSYPEDGRLIFMFGETYDEVERKLAIKNILMK
jgi:hypothetical protein